MNHIQIPLSKKVLVIVSVVGLILVVGALASIYGQFSKTSLVGPKFTLPPFSTFPTPSIADQLQESNNQQPPSFQVNGSYLQRTGILGR